MALRAKLGEVTEFFNRFSQLANCHLVNFITEDLWDTCVPEELKSEIEYVGMDSALSLFWDSKRDSASSMFHLSKYLMEANKMSTGILNDICLSPSDLRSKIISWGSSSQSIPQLNQFMSPKKAHEVEIMSELVAALSKVAGTSHIVDVGSGKGYLTSLLALHHSLKVLGVDSSSVNTHGATKRTQKLQKAWRPALIKLEKPQTEKTQIRHGKHWKAKMQADASTSQNQQLSETENLESSEGVFALYKQATAYISEETDLAALVTEHFGSYDSCSNILLTGLHTCGNLAPACLQLFIRENNVSAVCNVGCCYHLLEEHFCENPFPKRLLCDSEHKLYHGFPLSQYLIRKKFVLGRNARMLSAQCVQRISVKREVPVEPLWYRSLLQVLLVEKCRHNLPEGQVGRLAAKCNSFPEYVSKALTKLGVASEVSLNEIESLYKSHQSHQQKLSVFFMLRAVLAPVIETIILLDRLLYLHEQGIADAHLVQLFDPVTSPRCYAVLAIKQSKLEVNTS
ncbi:probable methyltransferase-like protein 25 [Schistocerca piceifrons]|uniref:probable methyltransferase-like protein 25 n=1 Tax=Schistocerca piceifrons TaxID=274613 RepID=UPI001F5F03DA|nr:probable methyltransferase-like protein 25 [Schistocerca piceifrons]